MSSNYGSMSETSEAAKKGLEKPEKFKKKELDDLLENLREEIDIEEALQNAGFTKNHTACLLAISVVSTGIYAQLEANNLLGPELLCEWNLSGAEEALTTGGLFWGSAFGALIWGKIVDKMGRRFALLACSLLTYIFLFVSVFSHDYIFYFIFRFLAGLSFGGTYATYTYTTEIVSTQHRTLASLFLFVSQAVGTYLASILGMLVIPKENLGWEYYQTFISLLFCLGFISILFVPESPRFLLTSGNSNQALEVIKKFNPDCNHLVILRPVTPETRGSFRMLLNNSFCMKTLLVMVIITSTVRMEKYAVGLLFLENLQNPKAENCILVSGYDHVKIGCDRLSTKDYGLNIILSSSHLIAALFSKPMADFFGRRKSLLIFGFVTVLQITVFFFCKPDLVNTFLTLSSRSVITSSQMISFVYINELFPTSLRGIAYGTVLFFSDVASAIAPVFVQYLSKISYPAAISSLMLSALIWAIVMIFFKEETKDVAQSDSVSHSEGKNSRKQ